MERGTAVHALAMNTRKVIPYEDGARKGKAWEAFKAAHPDAEILTPAAYETARAMADALLAHPLFAKALDEARRRGWVEETVVWQRLGVWCRSTPDLAVPEWVAEVKTARTSSPDKWEFPRASKRAAHHVALYSYGEMLRRTKRGDPKDFLIFAVEPEPPHVVTVFRLTHGLMMNRDGRPGTLEAGERLYNKYFEQYRVCRDSNIWPAYSDAVCEIDVDDESDFDFALDDEAPQTDAPGSAEAAGLPQ